MIARRLTACLTAFALYAMTIFTPALETRALASQNQLSSPTTGTVGGLALTNNFNGALDSINTANSGGTAPTNQLSGSASLGNWWLNTAAPPYGLGMNDGTSNWPVLGSLDPTAHAWNVQIGGGVGTLASASTVDLCSTPRNYLTISGTTTITSFGSTCPAGVVKLVTFSGALNLTYNATSLIIPGGNSVQPTSPGDQATLVSLGGGNWQVAGYTPVSGAALVNPAIDVCSYVLTAATAPPSSKYLFSYGQAISRTTYATFLACSTITQSVTRTTGSPTLTGFTDTTQIGAAAPVEGSGIPTSDTIVSCAATTCTMAANATSSGTANVTIFPNGNGDGATTFNVPNCQGVTLAGRDNMSGTPRGVLSSGYFGANNGASPDALGAFGGAQSRNLSIANINAFTPTVSTFSLTAQLPTQGFLSGVQENNNQYGSNNTSPANLPAPVTGTITMNQLGSGTAHATVQPTLTANCMIRVLAMAAPHSSSLASNDNAMPPVADRRRA
jgi:hypothetical protein